MIIYLGRDLIKESFESGSAPDEQLQQGMLAAGLPPELAGLITKMGQGVRQGLINRDFLQRAPR
ncbi:hypothetical protein AAFN85_03420 [Mucilaginibacter sp. CAU 1740]|uniref:hypothetical protein n=1 Tax=Mucilaginibacter sp. CAU 1740 TaxID=3140365 RepID=UPI00325B7B9A